MITGVRPSLPMTTDITFDDLERAFAGTPVPGPALSVPKATEAATPASPAVAALFATTSPRTLVTTLAAPLPGRPTRTLRACVTSAYVESWPPATHGDDVWPETPSAPGRLVVVLKLADGSTAYSVTYGNPIWPDRTVDGRGLRAFGWRGNRDAAGQPLLEAVELEVVVQRQFELGFGEVQIVVSVTVMDPEPGLDGDVPLRPAPESREEAQP
ncbi:MAG: hypothetical protein WAL61_13655 [Acidimicrobiales bacterium]